MRLVLVTLASENVAKFQSKYYIIVDSYPWPDIGPPKIIRKAHILHIQLPLKIMFSETLYFDETKLK